MEPSAREFLAEGRVQPLARLGVGGMGEVLLARRTGALGFEKLIAMKVIRADRAHNPEARRMFTDEARLLARLDHPSIAQVYELGEQDGVLFLTMEYVPGVPLGSHLSRSKRPLPPAIAAMIVASAARAVHAAHELTDLSGAPLGVVHRDLSPQNIMLTFDGRVKVLDFGVAWMRDREAESTDTGAVKGKLAYLAPEQIASRPVDRRADVYALSIVAYELLTARRLFGGDSLAAALRRPKVRPPSARSPEVSAELDAIVLRGLDKDPDARWPTARALAEALEAVALSGGGETLEAFAQRELAAQREENRALIERVSRAPEVSSVASEPSPRLRTEQLSDADIVETPRRSRRGWGLLLLALVLVAAPGVSELRVRWRALSEPPASAPQPPTATPAGLAMSLPPSDARAGGTSTVARMSATATRTRTATTIELFGDTSTLTDGEQLSEASEGPDDEEEEEGQEPTPDGGVLSAPPRGAPGDAGGTFADRPPPRLRPRASRPPARANEGSLTVLARPGGTIYVNGRPVGATPLLRHRLPAGRHMLALRRPGDTRPRWQAHATIHVGRHLRIELK